MASFTPLTAPAASSALLVMVVLLGGAGIGLAQGIPGLDKVPPPPPPQLIPGLAAAVQPNVSLIASTPAGLNRRVEHTPVAIPFTLEARPGVGGARPTMNLAVCEERNTQNCVEFVNVTPPWTSPSGATLTVKAPAASPTAKVTLVACIAARDANQVVGCGRQLTSDDAELITSMQVMVRLDKIRILNTRSPIRDTVYTAIGGVRNDQQAPTANRCSYLGGFNVNLVPCAGPRLLGNVRNGDHALTQMVIGPFEFVPDRQQNLVFAYHVVNYGHPIAIGPKIEMPGFVTRMMLLRLKQLPIDPDMTPEFNALNGWRGCDGTTAAAMVRFLNYRVPGGASIDDLTKANGRFVVPFTKTFTVPARPGCRNSKYQVQYTLERTSWRAN